MIALKMLLGVDYYVAKMLYSAFYKDSNPLGFNPFESHIPDPRIHEALSIIQNRITELRGRKGYYGAQYWNITLKKMLLWLITVRENVYRPMLNNSQCWYQLTDEIFEDFFEYYEYEFHDIEQRTFAQPGSGAHTQWDFSEQVHEYDRAIGNEFINKPELGLDFPDYTRIGNAVLLFNRSYMEVQNLPEGPLPENITYFQIRIQNWAVPGYKKNFCEKQDFIILLSIHIE